MILYSAPAFPTIHQHAWFTDRDSDGSDGDCRCSCGVRWEDYLYELEQPQSEDDYGAEIPEDDA